MLDAFNEFLKNYEGIFTFTGLVVMPILGIVASLYISKKKEIVKNIESGKENAYIKTLNKVSPTFQGTSKKPQHNL